MKIIIQKWISWSWKFVQKVEKAERKKLQFVWKNVKSGKKAKEQIFFFWILKQKKISKDNLRKKRKIQSQKNDEKKKNKLIFFFQKFKEEKQGMRKNLESGKSWKKFPKKKSHVEKSP